MADDRYYDAQTDEYVYRDGRRESAARWGTPGSTPQSKAPLGVDESETKQQWPAEPTMSTEEARRVVDTKTAPRVTEQSIKDKIGNVEYLHGGGLLTICVITMRNGFMVTGESAPASAENFDRSVGQRYAYDTAFKKLWQLEGYLLREKLRESAP